MISSSGIGASRARLHWPLISAPASQNATFPGYVCRHVGSPPLRLPARGDKPVCRRSLAAFRRVHHECVELVSTDDIILHRRGQCSSGLGLFTPRLDHHIVTILRDMAHPLGRATGPGRDQTANDDVFLQTNQLVPLTPVPTPRSEPAWFPGTKPPR